MIFVGKKIFIVTLRKITSYQYINMMFKKNVHIVICKKINFTCYPPKTHYPGIRL